MILWARIKSFFRKIFRMTNKDDEDELSWVDVALGVISGAALGYGLYRLLKGGFYTCPNCGFTKVPNNALECPRCRMKLRWL